MKEKDFIRERILKRLEPTLEDRADRIQAGDRKILRESPRQTAERLWREMTSEQRAIEYENELRLYDLENQASASSASAVSASSSARVSDILSCDPGTTWKDITITLLSKDMVKIATPKGTDRFTYHQLGLQDKRAGDRPTKLWSLLALFAKRTGFLHSENISYDDKLPDTAKRLDKHLQNLFGINERIYAGHYKKEGGYRTKIRFEDNTF